LISGQAELSVDFEVSFTVVDEVAIDVPGEVVPGVPLVVPCIISQEVSIPGKTKQKREGGGSHNKG
jgi:hypothetical protein